MCGNAAASANSEISGIMPPSKWIPAFAGHPAAFLPSPPSSRCQRIGDPPRCGNPRGRIPPDSRVHKFAAFHFKLPRVILLEWNIEMGPMIWRRSLLNFENRDESDDFKQLSLAKFANVNFWKGRFIKLILLLLFISFRRL